MPHSEDTNLVINPHFSGPGGVQLGGICLTDAGKRFNRDWIFRHVNYIFETGRSYAITGPNGSGKSTLLQAIAGSMNLSEGSLIYQNKYPVTNTIDPEKTYQHISIAAPYLELIEEMTAKEFLHFHHQFKPLLSGVTIAEILSIIGLENAADKQIRYFSSGMKQRIKLAQAIFSNAPVLLLDEPYTGLDQTSARTLSTLLRNLAVAGRTVIMSTHEYGRGLEGVTRAVILKGGRIDDEIRQDITAEKIAQLGS